MPVISNRGRGGATLVPSNARAADVASRMVEQLVPLQQRRTAAAFRVQGLESVLYTHLTSGRVCSCKSSETQLSGLSPDGKAPEGVINRMIAGVEFDVSPYSNRPAQKASAEDGFYIDWDAHDDAKRVGPDLTESAIVQDSPGVGDAGAYDPANLDDIINSFDAVDVGFLDVACPICFGTSFVGGYTPYRTWRSVLVPLDFDHQEYVDYTKSPWELPPCTFSTSVVLPRGAVAIDSFRVFRNRNQVWAKVSIDGHSVDSPIQALTYCDGRPHLLSFETAEPMTHVELQFALSRESAYFEFPKLARSSDRSLLDSTEPFQILMSPEVPQISSMDVIVESQTGRALLVGNVTPWQSRQRSGLGWECQVRVVQPQELYTLLPRRGKVYGQQALNMVPRAKVGRNSGYQTK